MATLFNTLIQETYGKLVQVDDGGRIQNGLGLDFTSSLQLTGSIEVTGGITGSVLGTATTASYAVSASYILAGATASLAVTASNANTASLAVTASNADSASLAVTASHALTASSVDPLRQNVQVTGSMNLLGNLSVIGTASFILVTASQVLVEQNTITVFGDSQGSVLPTAGYVAADTSSTYVSGALASGWGTGSFLYHFENEFWQSNTPISASYFNGTASYAAKTPTREFTVTSSNTWWLNHNLGTEWVHVTCWDTATKRVILPDEIEAMSSSSVKITWTTPIAGLARIS